MYHTNDIAYEMNNSGSNLCCNTKRIGDQNTIANHMFIYMYSVFFVSVSVWSLFCYNYLFNAIAYIEVYLLPIQKRFQNCFYVTSAPCSPLLMLWMYNLSGIK